MLRGEMLAVFNSRVPLGARTIGRRLTTHSSFSFFAHPPRRAARSVQVFQMKSSAIESLKTVRRYIKCPIS